MASLPLVISTALKLSVLGQLPAHVPVTIQLNATASLP